MNKKKFIGCGVLLAASALSSVAHAAVVPGANLTGWEVTNIFTTDADSGGDAETSNMFLDLSTYIQSGSVSMGTETSVTNMSYSAANWDINLVTSTITATGVTCVNNPGFTFDACGGFFEEGSVTAITHNAAGPGPFQVVYDQGGTTELVNTFQFGTAAVPVPAAAWLFGSALLGLAGVGRRRRAS
ncbi:MAG: hypothetical protein V7746_13375 [Halioglobus sp.]